MEIDGPLEILFHTLIREDERDIISKRTSEINCSFNFLRIRNTKVEKIRDENIRHLPIRML
jgi:hypothetical protein